MSEPTRSVELETACRRLQALAKKYERTEVADYQGELHVRCGRKVVAVFNYFEGTVRFNTAETAEHRSRINEVLEILGSIQRTADEIIVHDPSAPAIPARAQVWRFPSGSPYAADVLTCFAPRECFTLSYLQSPLSSEYGTTEADYTGSEDGEVTGIIDIEQPARSWVEDNLRDISEVANA